MLTKVILTDGTLEIVDSSTFDELKKDRWVIAAGNVGRLLAGFLDYQELRFNLNQ